MRQIPFGKPIIGDAEKKAVAAVLSGDTLVHGPIAKQFESAFQQFVGGEKAVSVSSCTAALHLCYFSLGLGPNDEVIVPAQTHTATAHAVELCRAKPVFVDAEFRTGNIDIDQIEDSITARTRALSIVHYLGMPVDMQRIMQIAAKHKLFVVEDCALALGTYYKGTHAGFLGDAGCFSFYPVKHMTTAEGGMLTTRHADLATAITFQRAFGVDRSHTERAVPGTYDVTMLGLNYRMNEIEAAIGIEQLKRMPEFLRKRGENYAALVRGINEISELSLFDTILPGSAPEDGSRSSYYCQSTLLNERLAPKRLDLVNALKAKGIGTSVYYPRPVPHFSYYKGRYGYDERSFPVAKMISDRSLALPVGPHLGLEDMQYIVDALKQSISQLLGNP